MSHSYEGAPRIVSESFVGNPLLPALDNTYGALLIGTAVGLVIYGMTVLQTYEYFRLYPNDRPVIVWMVIVILALETFHTIQTVEACYWHLVSDYWSPVSLLQGHWSTRLMVPTTGLMVLVCQSFYARRVWYVGPQCRYIVGVVACIMFVILGFVIATTVESFRLSLHDFQHFSWLASVIVGLAAAGDAILTVTLITLLLRRRTGFIQTDSTIDIIIVYTVNTGLLSLVFAICTFIFAIVLPGNLIYIGFSIVNVKLYANCVLAVLNSRRALSTRILEGGLEITTRSGHPARPHTEAETWDVPQGPGRAKLGEATGTTINFARPTNLTNMTTDFDFSGTGTASVHTGAEGSGKLGDSQKDVTLPL
ncbi:hypothetical protein OH76DRAFT_1487458 [Lentinus brumalis]|uniref:DUF6534 domain-containing protein n=1 Tax=Lentinus brumalis TaxID=2498619 RepID=A0A371CUR4_9APHY|nr:hypothetical protein OH76DRAFT_1487458 [Polyporus brumalis]